MELKNKIKSLRKENGLTQKELAEKLDVAPTAVSAWERGANKPLMDKIHIMSDLFSVPVSDFFNEKPENVINIKPVKNIPVISKVACGDPIFSEDNYEDSVPYPAELLPGGKTFFVKADGNSMSPTIKDEELVLVREQSEVENGEIACVIFYDDEPKATLKKVKKIDGAVILEPDNDDFDSYLIKEDDNVRILGKAIFVISEL